MRTMVRGSEATERVVMVALAMLVAACGGGARTPDVPTTERGPESAGPTPTEGRPTDPELEMEAAGLLGPESLAPEKVHSRQYRGSVDAPATAALLSNEAPRIRSCGL